MCTFCKENIISTNLLRHIERDHCEEKEVQDILKLPRNSEERRQKCLYWDTRLTLTYMSVVSNRATSPCHNHRLQTAAIESSGSEPAA